MDEWNHDIEIMFEDLNEETQKVVLEAMGIEKPEEANLDAFPLFVLPIGD